MSTSQNLKNLSNPDIESSSTGNRSSDDEDQSLRERTYRLISEMILNGDLAYGDPIQERRLADQLNVSRTPVREAISRLEAEGFLERSCGRVIVREVRLKEFVEILHVRKLLECDAAREAANKVDIKELKKLRVKIEELMAKKSVTALELRDVDDKFHNFIA